MTACCVERAAAESLAKIGRGAVMCKETTAFDVEAHPCLPSARLCDSTHSPQPSLTSTLISSPGCVCFVAVVWGHSKIWQRVRMVTLGSFHFILNMFVHVQSDSALCALRGCSTVTALPHKVPEHATPKHVSNRHWKRGEPPGKRRATCDTCSRNQQGLTACINSLLARTREPLHHNLIRPPMPLRVRNQRQAACSSTMNLEKSSV